MNWGVCKRDEWPAIGDDVFLLLLFFTQIYYGPFRQWVSCNRTQIQWAFWSITSNSRFEYKMCHSFLYRVSAWMPARTIASLDYLRIWLRRWQTPGYRMLLENSLWLRIRMSKQVKEYVQHIFFQRLFTWYGVTVKALNVMRGAC